ncbi:MAG: proprotein convertase P-domain-containing protein, partial [Phycisphaerales bacterium]
DHADAGDDLAGFQRADDRPERDVPGGLPNDSYRLTLIASGFQDADGNFLNGTTAAPLPSDNEVYNFMVVSNSGAFEPNDTVTTSTPVVFSTSGRAIFDNALIGDGTAGQRDVDIYRFTLTGPGLIIATVDARSLPLPSSLDSVLSLYDSASLVPMTPMPVARNDNFNGLDSRLEYFVPTGGTYYLVVSGFGNSTFDPRVAGSGTPGSVGDYRLTIDVAVDTSDPVTVNATGLPLPIPDPVVGVPQTLSSSISVFDSRRIQDLNVRMTLTHPFVSDLQVRLRHHIEGQDVANDRVVSLVLARGGAGDDFVNTVFDDEALTSIITGAAPFTGSFQPEQPLNRFDGQSAAGVWTLEVTDTRAPSVGTLVSWGMDFTLANNVFGPFELNDTIGLVTTPILNGVGAATRDAFIGDGAFGLRDVDLFQIVAPAGTTITATVNVPLNPGDPAEGPSSNHLDTVLRLFDGAGNELVLDNRGDTQNSSLSFVVDPGGTFFIGVSGADNTMYSILNGGSGVGTSATGNYRLTVQVSGGISNGTVLTAGSASGVTLGVNADGSIGVPQGSVPANASVPQPAGIALAGNEFILARSLASESFFGGTYNGFSFQNSGPAGRSDLEVSVADESDPANRRIVITGLFRDLRIQRTFSYGINDHFIAVDVTLTNTSSSDINDVAWVEAFNPQTGLNRGTSVARTVNNVDNATGRLVTASFVDNGFPGGLTIGFATGALPSGLRATAAVQDLNSVRDPFQVLDNASPDPDTSMTDSGVEADKLIAMSIGTTPTERIGADQSISFRYFILVGASLSEVQTQYAMLVADTGTGHLVQDPQGADPLRGYDPDTGLSSLPYAVYYPEGYANDRASTFIPIVNTSASAARVVVIARYENGVRDQVLYDSATGDIDGDGFVDETIAPSTRTGLTITTPAMYAANTTLVRKDEPYSIEVRSSQPVAANLSHFDFGVSTGEAFSNITSNTWTFGEGFFGDGVNDFVVFYNPGVATVRVTLTIYPENGAAAFSVPSFDLQGLRRGGWSLANLLQGQLPSGTPFGMRLVSQGPIVAALSHYDTNLRGGFGVLGTPSLGSTTGATPEGQLGISASAEFVTVLNTNDTAADVNFTFFFQNGSAYRYQLNVPANRRGGFSVGSLVNFPAGQQAYSITYESNVPVAMTLPSFAFGEATGSEFATQAATTWAFADGFRPLAGGQVTEYLRLFNPTASTLSVEITMDFNDGGTETFRRTLAPSAANEFDIHDFVTGFRRTDGTVPGIGTFYGIRVRAAQPIVAYMAHFDANFFGGFGTLGTPIGLLGPIG